MRRHALPWPNTRLLEQADDAPGWRAWFDRDELAVADAFGREQRRRQWLLSRRAAKELALESGLVTGPLQCRVERTRITRPDGVPVAFTSLSHSGPYAMAAIDERPVGVDVQVVRELSERAAHLFLTAEEEEAMRSCSIPHRVLHFWCAKEAVWKALAGGVTTLRQVPLELRGATAAGLRFESVETYGLGDLVAAVTRPIS